MEGTATKGLLSHVVERDENNLEALRALGNIAFDRKEMRRAIDYYRRYLEIEPDDPLDGCMAMMAERGYRHLPVLDAGKVVGVISMGEVVKNTIRDLELNVSDLMGHIMADGPGG